MTPAPHEAVCAVHSESIVAAVALALFYSLVHTDSRALPPMRWAASPQLDGG